MAKTKISEWSTTPASNTDIDGINIAEGCAPSGINDAIRDLMAQVRSWQSGATGDPFNGPIGTTPSTGAFTTLSASSTFTLSGLTASTALALDASKNVVSVTNTGSGNNVLATSPTLVTPALGTPSSATLTNATGLPISTGVSGLGTGVATALAVNVGSAGAPVVNGGALGTPSSGTVTNLTGTASININGTVGATTPTTGAFTTLSASSSVTLSGGTANGVTYLNGSKVLTSGSALTFDGTTFGVNPNVANSTSMLITGTYTGGGTATMLAFQRAGGAVAGAIKYSDVTGAIEFGTTTNHTLLFLQNNAEAMRLTSTGLGIGTSSPSYKLDVSAGSGVGIRLKSTGAYGTFRADNTGTTGGGLYTASQNGVQCSLFGIDGAILGNTSTDTAIFSDVVGGSIKLYTNASATAKATLDSSGNLGLGVTPSASTLPIIQSTYGVFSGNTNINIMNNAYYNSGWKYVGTGLAAQYQQDTGKHIWYTAASGTAGNPITFTQAATLTANGDYLVGTTTDVGSSSNTKKVVGGNFRTFQNTATIPALSTATILTLSSSVTGVYIVNANFGPQGNAIYGGMLIVVANNGSFRIVTNGSGASSALTMSGANVQITNALGSPLDATGSVMFIGN